MVASVTAPVPEVKAERGDEAGAGLGLEVETGVVAAVPETGVGIGDGAGAEAEVGVGFGAGAEQVAGVGAAQIMQDEAVHEDARTEQPVADRGSTADNAADKGHIQGTAGSIADTVVAVVDTTVQGLVQQPEQQLAPEQ